MHSELGSKNLPENYSKRTKMAIRARKFSGGACPRVPLEPLLFLNQLQIVSAEKRNTLEKDAEIMPPPLLTFLATPLTTGYLHSQGGCAVELRARCDASRAQMTEWYGASVS